MTLTAVSYRARTNSPRSRSWARASGLLVDEWLLERRPPADLAGQLVCAWRGDIGEARTLLPDECVDMFWTGGSVRVSGPETRSWPSAAAPGTDVVGVCFRSGVASLSGVAVQVAAFTGVKDRVSGLAGGMVSTAQEVGAALGLAIIATAALARSGQVMHAAGSQTAVRALAQTAGFQRGALVAAGFSIAAALAAGLLLWRAEQTAASARLPPAPEPAVRAARDPRDAARLLAIVRPEIE